jgi:hypothetical protein
MRISNDRLRAEISRQDSPTIPDPDCYSADSIYTPHPHAGEARKCLRRIAMTRDFSIDAIQFIIQGLAQQKDDNLTSELIR